MNDLNNIPSEYRHYFYPPIIVDINFGDAKEIPEDFFGIKNRQKKIDEAMVQYFMNIFNGIEATIVEKPLEIQIIERLKYAYILEGGKRYITKVDNETMKAYRMHDNSYHDGLLYPLEEITDFTFERWCRGMDL